MKCPNCNEILLMTERNQVEIDYCPSCRGIWLDKGELDKLMDYAASQATITNPPQRNTSIDNRNYHQNDERSRYHHKEKDYRENHNQRYPQKKKSFLSDFFDFD